jgi:uncharacterized glyoxalase superfamily protein PhnB
MKNPPAGWPRISNSVYYDDPRRAIDWLVKAFGFEVRLKVECDDGAIEHSELTFGDGLIMVGDAAKANVRNNGGVRASPQSVGGANTQQMCIHVDDVDATCARARAAGGKVMREPTTTDYGEDYWIDRSCEVGDPEGHRWYFMQRLSRD